MESQPLSRRKKKMKKKKRLIQEATDVYDPNIGDSVKKTTTKLDKIIEELGLDKLSGKATCCKTKDCEPVMENVMSIRSHEPEVVIFPKRQKKQKTVQLNNEDKQFEVTSTPKSLEFNIKKARHEVLKFGISGFEKPHREEAKVVYAISLGAKPPKRKYINYKDLIEQKKKEKTELEQQKKGHEMLRKIGSRKTSKKTKRRKVHSKSNTS